MGFFCAQRRLFISAKVKVVDMEIVEDKCWVRHLNRECDIEAWAAHNDHFYYKDNLYNSLPESTFEPFAISCEDCLSSRQAHLGKVKSYKDSVKNLKAFEFFSGQNNPCVDLLTKH